MSSSVFPRGGLTCVLIAVAVAACGNPKAKRPVERVALLPLENLSSSASDEWVGRAVAEIAAEQARTGPVLAVYAARDSRDAALRRSTRIVDGYWLRGARGLEAHLSVRDVERGRTVQPIHVTAPDALSLAGELARQLVAAPRRPPTGNQQAVEQFFRGDPVRAVELDPAFTPAALAASTRLEPRAALAVLERARAGADSVDQARLDLARAELERNWDARLQALDRLSRLEPAWSDLALELGRNLFVRRRWADARAALERAIAAEPDFPEAHNQRAYCLAYLRDIPAALDALARYEQCGGPAANVHDSRGDILFLGGRFAEAADQYSAAHDKDPAFLAGAPLRKAAQARRLAGQRPESDALFARFLSLVPEGPSREFLGARWDYLGGKRDSARQRLRILAGKAGFSSAWAELAFWERAEGRSGRDEARQALAAARSPAEQAFARLAAFVTQAGASPVEWSRRAAAAFPAPAKSPWRQRALALALFLNGHPAEAAGPLAEVVEGLRPLQSGPWEVAWAAALIEAGRLDDARRALPAWPVPATGGDTSWEWLEFPRVLEVKSRLEPARAQEYQRVLRLYAPPR